MRTIFTLTIALVSATVGKNIHDDLDIDWTQIKGGHKIINIQGEPSFDDSIQTRIVGGKPARPHQFPYQVGLAIKVPEGTTWCGGSLISKNYVITAAHCVNDASGAIVFLGAHNTGSREEGQVRMRLFKSDFIVHSAYNDVLVRNDIALIRLPKPAPLSNSIQLIALPKANIETEGRYTTASGWGLLKDGGSVSSQLHYVTLKTISLKRCSYYFSGLIRETHVCADASFGKSTCQGDSGGPLVVEEKGVKTLIGLTSFGSPRGCKSGWPSVYTRVSSYLNWIQDHSDIKL